MRPFRFVILAALVLMAAAALMVVRAPATLDSGVLRQAAYREKPEKPVTATNYPVTLRPLLRHNDISITSLHLGAHGDVHHEQPQSSF